MDNLYDYIMWTGNFSFKDKEFCDIDALVLTQLSYFDFKLFEPSEKRNMTLRETFDAVLRERGTRPPFTGIKNSRSSQFLEAAVRSLRFGNLQLSNYTEELDPDVSVQFSAVTFVKPGDFRYIAFRGTDESITGWKEDCMMSFTRIKAQEMALEYVKNNIDPKVRNFIGGHSKGGNLALYASVNIPFDIWDNVEQVYLLDSPGLCSEVMDTSNIKKVDRRATRIIPEFCVIGKLFEPDIRNTVTVSSDEKGLMQHDMLSWSVDHGRLNRVDRNDPQSFKMDGLINSWIEDLSMEERQAFVNDLFDALSADGNSTLSDISDGGVDSLERIVFNLAGSSRQTKKAVASLPEKAVFGNTIKNIKKAGFLKWFEQCKVAKSLILIAVGIYFIFASNKALDITAMLFFIALAGIQLFITIKRLIEVKWDFGRIKERIYLLVILIAVCVVTIIKDDALFLFGSLLYGIVAIILGFRQLGKAKEKNIDIFIRIFRVVETVLLFIYGISFLVIPSNTIYAYSLSIGIFLISDGALRLGYRIFRQFVPYKEPVKPKRTRSHRRQSR